MGKEAKTIEKFSLEKRLDSVTLAGVKAREGWKTGKCVTEKEFDEAVKAYCAGTIAGGGDKNVV